MAFEIGVLFAFAALIFWGFGDFLIQNSTRKFGDWETLFVIALFGTAILSPFVYKDVLALFSLGNETLLILFGVSTALLIGALLDFESLRQGKIAVVEPLLALEVPVTVILAFVIINEALEPLHLLLISVLVVGLVLVSLKSHHLSRRSWIEHGVVLAVVAAVFIGMSNFLVGFASRITTPLLTNWFIDIFLAGICLFHLMQHRRIGSFVNHFRANRRLLLSVSFFDNLAWISFAIAATLVPIAIALALSESYIALAALLGLVINKERLLIHQKAGLVITLTSVIALSIIYA